MGDQIERQEGDRAGEQSGRGRDLSRLVHAEPTAPRVNLEAFYQEQVDRLKAEHANPERILQRLRKLAGRKEERGKEKEQEEEAKTFGKASESRTMHRHLLRLQAKIEGIKDLDRFMELADYLESTETVQNYRYVSVPKGLSQEGKREILEKWSKEGYTAQMYDFHEGQGDKKGELTLRYRKPLSLRREHVKQLKKLLNSENNPTEIARGLHALGFRFDVRKLSNSEDMDEIATLFSAPHAKEAMVIAENIGNWSDDDWMSREVRHKDFKYQNPENAGQLRYLVGLARAENPESILSSEQAKQIDLLLRASGREVNTATIEDFKQLIARPDYLEFAVYALEKTGIPSKVRIFDTLSRLDERGLLEPMLQLARAKVDIVFENKTWNRSSLALDTLFGAAGTDDEKGNERVELIMREIQEQLDTGIGHQLLEDQQRYDFIYLTNHMMDYPWKDEELSESETYYENRARIIYLWHLVDTGEPLNKWDMQHLNEIAQQDNLMQVYTRQDFAEFLRSLREKLDYKVTLYDFYFEGGRYSSSSSRLATVFSDERLRDGLLQDSTIAIVKLQPPSKQLDLHQAEFYIQIAEHPAMARAITVLRELGYVFDPSNFISPEFFLELANNTETISLLASEDTKQLVDRLHEAFGWDFRTSNLSELIELAKDPSRQVKVFAQENLDFIKKMRPYKLYDLNVIGYLTNIGSEERAFLTKLVDVYGYRSENSSITEEQVRGELLQDPSLQEKLFSEHTQNAFRRVKQMTDQDIYLQELLQIADLPDAFLDEVQDLRTQYGYTFRFRDREALNFVFANKEAFTGLLHDLAERGYSLKGTDIPKISRLLPIAPELPAVLDHLQKVYGYVFQANDIQTLLYIAEKNLTEDELAECKRVFDRYNINGSYNDDINFIPQLMILKESTAFLTELESVGYQFDLGDFPYIYPLLRYQNKEELLTNMRLFNQHLGLPFNLHLANWYVMVAKVPDLAKHLEQAEDLIKNGEFQKGYSWDNLKLFVTLGVDQNLYTHAKQLLSHEYFINVRDAGRRLQQITSAIREGKLPETTVARIFALSQKPADAERMLYNLSVAAEIAKVAGIEEWYAALENADGIPSLNNLLERKMVELALPLLYADLPSEEQAQKSEELLALAKGSERFTQTLQISCRSVAIYASSEYAQQKQFPLLMGAIRQALELNRENDPQMYAEKRLAMSSQQFDRLLEDFPEDKREQLRSEALAVWANLKPRRRLTLQGTEITREEETMERLERIRSTVNLDLGIHLSDLLRTRMQELEGESKQEGGASSGSDLQGIYKKYLFSPRGELQEDIPQRYKLLLEEIRTMRNKLKDQQTPRDEKQQIGRNLGTYQGIATLLRSLYKLGAIEERKLKGKTHYAVEVDNQVQSLISSLKKLRLLDPERRANNQEVFALENEVLHDLDSIKSVMRQDVKAALATIETKSTVDFNTLATAPEMTLSCQRLTELTGYNHAAYARLLDGVDEMVDISERSERGVNLLSRSFIELSKLKLPEEENPRLTVLIDRQYDNPQYQGFSQVFTSEMLLHMIDRIADTPEMTLLFSGARFPAYPNLRPDLVEALKQKGYQLKLVSGRYFVPESNLRFEKYYDSFSGRTDVSNAYYMPFKDFWLVEKVRPEVAVSEENTIKKEYTIRDEEEHEYKISYIPSLQNDSQELQTALPRIREIAKLAFPHWSAARIQKFLENVEANQSLSLIYAPDGNLVGFSVFKVGNLEGFRSSVKVFYTDYAAIDPQYEGKGLTERSRRPILSLVNPDIIAGLTGNPAIYRINERLAQERGMTLYPRDATPPLEVVSLGQMVLEQFSPGSTEKLDDRLVKTRSTLGSRGTGSFQLFDEELHLEPNQQVLYLAIKPELEHQILGQ